MKYQNGYVLTGLFLLVSFFSTALMASSNLPYKILSGEAIQGGFVLLEIEKGGHLKYKGYRVDADENGRVLIAFSRDDKPKQEFKVLNSAGVVTNTYIEIQQREYAIQRIDGLPKNKVTPDKKTSDKIWQDILQAKKARKINLPTAYFDGGFDWPAKGIISGVYGSQRVLNGKPRRPHFGVDVAAPTGTPLYAPGDGKITLQADMVLSGKTVMIDHGYGLRSTVMHLHKIKVEEGDIVKKGDIIGEVGSTGRSTGPHVHWGMSWFNVRLDPALTIQPQTLPGDKVAPEINP